MTMATLLVLVFWFMLSFVIASAADQRGRSPFSWFLLSVLTTPVLAALFLLLFPPLDRPTSVRVNDFTHSEEVGRIEAPPRRGSGSVIVAVVVAAIAILWILGSNVETARWLNRGVVENSSTNKSTPSMQSNAIAYEAVATLTCIDLLNSLDTNRYSELIDPIIEFIGQQDELGTPVNRTSYVLTECRLRESQTIGKAVQNLFEQKRLKRLPQIPIGGGTSDAYVRTIWVPFDKWIRHQGPRPNFSAAAGL